MVRSKKNMSSKKTLKNTHQPQLNNPSRNVNNLSGHTENINRQNYNMRNTETQVPEWYAERKQIFGRKSNDLYFTGILH